jgi:hypothetical protein
MPARGTGRLTSAFFGTAELWRTRSTRVAARSSSALWDMGGMVFMALRGGRGGGRERRERDKRLEGALAKHRATALEALLRLLELLSLKGSLGRLHFRQEHFAYRGTSPIRKRPPPLGPPWDPRPTVWS